MLSSTSSLFFLALAALTTARTDLTGCTSTQVIAFGGASLLYYVPGTGEICSFLDCGGGTAPPKTTVPGCPLYSGTATVTPSFLSGIAQAAPTDASSGDTPSATPNPTLAAQTTVPTGSGTITLQATTVTDTGLVIETDSGSVTGVGSAAGLGTTGTPSTSAKGTSASPTVSPTANAAVGLRCVGGLAGLVAVGALVL